MVVLARRQHTVLDYGLAAVAYSLVPIIITILQYIII